MNVDEIFSLLPVRFQKFIIFIYLEWWRIIETSYAQSQFPTKIRFFKTLSILFSFWKL